jgi:predicted AAA+ superfamily ATPase
MDISNLFKLDSLARKSVTDYQRKRLIYKDITESLKNDNRFISLIGPRGVGKTILLRQLASEINNSFYISMDSFEGESLFDVVKGLNEKNKISLFLIDEIHFLNDYQKEIKNIYDFLNVKIVFTSSVSLSLYESSYDLSRRVKIFNIYPFSFREYIYFSDGVLLDPLSISDIYNGKYTPDYLKYSYLFKEYMVGGCFPFSLDNLNVIDIIKTTLKTIISRDIPAVKGLRVDELAIIEKIIRFISISSVDGISFSSISNNLKITKYKAEQYVDLLNRAFVLNTILPYGTNVLREPKILMYLSYRLIFNDYNNSVGALREDFVAQCLKTAGYNFYYLKSSKGEKTPDYLIGNDDMVVEVGGKGKGRSQFKSFNKHKKMILSDNINITEKKNERVPLFMLGYIS